MSVNYSQSSSFQINSSDFSQTKMPIFIEDEEQIYCYQSERYHRQQLPFHQANGDNQQGLAVQNFERTKQTVYNIDIKTIRQLFLCIIFLQKFQRNIRLVKCGKIKLQNKNSLLLCYHYIQDIDFWVNQKNQAQMSIKLNQSFDFDENSIPTQYLAIINTQLALRPIILSMLNDEDLVIVNVQNLQQDIETNIQIILDYFQYDFIIIDRINQAILILQRSPIRNQSMNQRLKLDSNKQYPYRQQEMNLEGLMKLNWNDGLCLDLQKLWCHLRNQHLGKQQEWINKNEQMISNLIYNKSFKSYCSIEIFERVSVKFIISFESKNQMKNFIKDILNTYLWHGLQQNNKKSLRKNATQMNVKDLAHLSSVIDFFQAQHFKKAPSSFNKYDKRQSYELIFEKQPSEGNILQKVNAILKRFDLLSMKSMWDGGLSDYLESICKNWEVYKGLQCKELQIFTMVTLYKMYKIDSANKHTQIYQNIYPKLNYFMNFFMEKLGISSIQAHLLKIKGEKISQKQGLYLSQQQEHIVLETIRKELNIQQTLADKIFCYFLKQDKPLDIHVPLNAKKKASMSSFIAECQQFYLNSRHWNQIFTSFMRQLHTRPEKSLMTINYIEKERLVENRCLGCSTFFVEEQNIYDQQVFQSPLKVFLTVAKLKDYQTQIKDWICAMMNSGGGIILFDCFKDYKEIKPIGLHLNHKDKEQIEQRMYSYSSQFYPKIQVKSHIYVTFVPIFYSAYDRNIVQEKYVGLDSILKENYSFKKRKQYKGKYVTRIKVTPIDPSLVYFWSAPSKILAQGQLRKYCQVIKKDGAIKQLSNREMIKFIKEKIDKFYKNETFNEEQKNILSFPSTFIHHKCLEPELGISLKEKKVNKSTYISLEDQYNYLSLLVARPQDLPRIRENFRKRNFNFKIPKYPQQNLFKDYSFKSAKNTTALYHNTKFQEILNEIKNNRNYSFGNRQTIIINITSYLKLEKRNQHNPLDQKTFKQIEMDFSREYQNESLKLYKFVTQEKAKEYYFLTQSKTSNLFLYYLLNENGREKVVFKNPFLLDKLSFQERKARMMLIYEKLGRDQMIQNSPKWLSMFSQSYIFNVNSSFTFDHSIENLWNKDDESTETDAVKKEEITFWQNYLVSYRSEQSESKDCYLYNSWEQVWSEYDYDSFWKINLLK